MKQDPELPLAGYRALDLTDEKGFMCGKLLADLGVDVIKIEKPNGEPARMIGPFPDDNLSQQTGLYWLAFNVNKRGITLNIENRDGQEIFRRLVKTADFIIESYPPGYLNGLGLGYDCLSEINPQVVLTSITAFGQRGPKANHKTTELVSWASGGAMYCTGDADGPPSQLAFPQAYFHAGTDAAVGTLIAYHYRQISDEGQHVDVSIQESVIKTLMDTQEMWDLYKFNFRRSGHSWTFVRPDGKVVRQQYCLPCKDGWVAFYTLGGGMRVSVEHLKSVVRWMDDEGMAPDWLKNFDWVHDYETASLTQEKIDKVERALTEFLMTKTKVELYDRAIREHLLIAPVYTPEDITKDDHLKDREFFEEVYDPQLGKVLTYCGAWTKFSETPLKIRCHAPQVGEHNEDIYVKELGFSRQELLTLKQADII